jgi:peptide deformylase
MEKKESLRKKLMYLLGCKPEKNAVNHRRKPWLDDNEVVHSYTPKQQKMLDNAVNTILFEATEPADLSLRLYGEKHYQDVRHTFDLLNYNPSKFVDPLRSKCAPIFQVTEEIQQIAMGMIKLMIKENGVGLAAPQVGKLIQMIACVNNENTVNILINPVIVEKSKETNVDLEGCLSLPDQFVMVERHNSIKVFCKDIFGNDLFVIASGRYARIIQHEMDHLQGVMMLDHTTGESVADGMPGVSRV